MNCPECGCVMEESEAQLQGTLLGWLCVGLSYMELVFRTRNNRLLPLLRPSETKPAAFCHECQTLVIRPDPRAR